MFIDVPLAHADRSYIERDSERLIMPHEDLLFGFSDVQKEISNRKYKKINMKY